jgi:hypothetical protein
MAEAVVPWWLVIIGVVSVSMWGRIRGWPQTRRWATSETACFRCAVVAPALFHATIGGGSLYHLASGTTGGTGGSYRLSLGSRLPGGGEGKRTG